MTRRSSTRRKRKRTPEGLWQGQSDKELMWRAQGAATRHAERVQKQKRAEATEAETRRADQGR